jgi:hypothetical protein
MFKGILFRQRINEQPADAKQAGWELSFNARSLRSFFQRNNELPAGAKKHLWSSPQRTLDRSEYI